jgi:DNA replication protein DnaC
MQDFYKKFRLKFLQEHQELFLDKAQHSPAEALAWWIQEESALAKLNSEKARFKNSKLGVCLDQENFSWGFIDKPRDLKQQFDNLIRKDFIQQGRNIIFIGPEGVGKTTLSKMLAHQMILKGYNCKFVTLAHLIEHLSAEQNFYVRKKALATYTKPHLLVLDEVGYVSYNEKSADHFFQVIAQRYEDKKPVILNTNLAFQDWGKFLGTAHCVSAIIDRLIENASTIPIEAKSFRNHKHQKDTFYAPE